MKKQVIGWYVKDCPGGTHFYAEEDWVRSKDEAVFFTNKTLARLAAERVGGVLVRVSAPVRRITREELEAACAGYDSVERGSYDNCDEASLRAALATLGITCE